MTSLVTGLRRTPKHSKFAPKKGHGHCLVVCCQSDPLQLSESQRNHYTWEVCSSDGWNAPKPQHLQTALVNRTGLILQDNAWPHVVQPSFQKLNKLGCDVLPHPPYSPDHSPTNYHFFKHLDNFLQGKCFHNEQEAENAFQEFFKSQSTDFYATRINKLISHWQKCVDFTGSYFE